MLAEILNNDSPSLLFLSEPQVYQCDLTSILSQIEPDYCYSLNSEDVYEPDLPMVKSKAKGGTMILWRKWLDPFVRII